MGLSKEQELALYEALEVPYQTSVHKLQPEDNLTAIEYTAVNLATQAFILIQNRITEIEADADLLSLLQDNLNDWIALGNNVTTLQGGIGELNGVDDDPNRERNIIRAKIITKVPFYRHHDEMKVTESRSMNAGICR